MNVKGSKHMTLEQRTMISALLKVNCTCNHIAEEVGMDARTISKEIRRHRDPVKNKRYGQWERKDNSICPTLERFPYVCNGCKKKQSCFREYRYEYDPKVAQENYEIILSDSRVGIDMSLEDKEVFDEVLHEGVSKGQSVYHILTNNKDKIHCSISSAYRHVHNNNTIVQKIDLRRAVKLRPRKHYKTSEDTKAIRGGRKLQDFLREISKKPFPIITQMDTVEGPKGQKKCLLTLHITNTHFMLVKVLEDQTKDNVTKAFHDLLDVLGVELYKKVFEHVLTDRGTEFCDPLGIEIDLNTGEKIANVYYCNSYASYQKGAIEENHELIRYVIPKGIHFDDLTQEKADLIMSHINSYSRKSLDSTPYKLTKLLLGEELLEKTKVREIGPDSVCLTHKLVK